MVPITPSRACRGEGVQWEGSNAKRRDHSVSWTEGWAALFWLGSLDDSDDVGSTVEGARFPAGGDLFFQPPGVLFEGLFVAQDDEVGGRSGGFTPSDGPLLLVESRPLQGSPQS